MTQAEYDAFLDVAVHEYADDHVRAGDWHPTEALDKSRQQFAELLPQGIATPKHYLYSIEDTDLNASVGMIWFALLDQRPSPIAFVYDFRVEEQFRNRGYGRQALLAIEDKVKALGVFRIELHVFGHNRPALHLYEQVGYEARHIDMVKELAN